MMWHDVSYGSLGHKKPIAWILPQTCPIWHLKGLSSGPPLAYRSFQLSAARFEMVSYNGITQAVIPGCPITRRWHLESDLNLSWVSADGTVGIS
eukprot:scaffold1721_cov242-Pinguiococcus_pyrenoidosus.AAC.3